MNTLRNEFYRYTSLSVLGMLGSAGTILADTFFVSDRLGAQGLAALNLAICVFGLINGLGLLLGIGGATCYSIASARRQVQRANAVFSAAFWSSVGCGGVLAAAGLFLARPMAQLLGAEGAILPMAEVYLRTILCFAPWFILRHVYASFLRNDGNPRLAMASMLLGSLGNIALDWLFMYPLDMGIFGAALATALSPLLSILLCLPHLMGRRHGFHLVRRGLHLAQLRQICSFGAAAFVNEFSSGIVLLVFNLLILRCAGTLGVAAYGIVANLALIVLSVYTGLSQGVQPLLSRAHALGRAAEVRQVFGRGAAVATALGVLVTAAALRFAPALVGIFNSQGDPRLQAMAQEGLEIYFLSFLALGYNFMASSLLSATERSGRAFSLSFFRGCGGIIVCAVVFALVWGLRGVWLSVPAVEAVTLALSLLLLRRPSAAAEEQMLETAEA